MKRVYLDFLLTIMEKVNSKFTNIDISVMSIFTNLK